MRSKLSVDRLRLAEFCRQNGVRRLALFGSALRDDCRPDSDVVVGEKSVVDLIGVMGWHQTVSMLLNVDRYLLPEGAQPELRPLQ